ncbi:hypothetical protein ACQEV2_36980 [Streptomyces sp. CA-251387]|uniref:hypothetical protein n=1 Tax=Streptomyces sp. CA-251387 TaxID=3240064 RepID=UPI003D90A337
MPALLAVMAVVGYMATAGLPWWAVVAVVVLTAGLAGRTGMRKAATSQPVRSSADKCSTVVPVSVNVRAVTCPDEYTEWVCGGREPVLRNR